MPKQKSHRGAAKRFSFTKTGIVKHKQMNATHQVRESQESARFQEPYPHEEDHQAHPSPAR